MELNVKKVEFKMILAVGEFGVSAYRVDEKEILNPNKLPYTIKDDLQKGVNVFIKKAISEYLQRGVYLVAGKASLDHKVTMYSDCIAESLLD